LHPHLDDNRLREWVLLCNGLLWFLVELFGFREPRDLLVLVRERMPNVGQSDSQLSQEQVAAYRLWESINENNLGITPPNWMTITPLPNCIACLLHWRVLGFFLQQMSTNEREDFRACRDHRFWDGSFARPQQIQELPVPMTTVDSHMHPDLIQVERGTTDLRTLRTLYLDEEETIDIIGLVGNFTFPENWSRHLYFMEHVPAMVFTFGIHPSVYAEREVSQRQLEDLAVALGQYKCRALGEVGLDYYRHPFQQEQRRQRQSLARLLPLAIQHKKLVVIHCRDQPDQKAAQEDCLAILRRHLPATTVIHWHCFSGDRDDVKVIQETFPNAYFGITAVGLWLRGPERNTYQAAISAIPLDRLLLESDSPLLLPPGRESRAGFRRHSNHPWTLIDAAEAVGRWKGCGTAMILCVARLNAERIYGPF
jgi:TatD DNase family protein